MSNAAEEVGNVKIEFSSFIRKPFEVLAVEVTKKNIDDLADQLKLGDVYYDDDGVPYIELDEDKVPIGLINVYPGYWVTKVGKNNIRCYTRKIFMQQFVEQDEDIQEWMQYLNGKQQKRMPLPPNE